MPVEVGKDYIHVRQQDPTLFNDKTFRTKWLSKKEGVKAIFAKRKGVKNAPMEVQSLLFDREKWTPKKIIQWLKKKNFPFIPTEEQIKNAILQRESEELAEKLKGKEI